MSLAKKASSVLVRDIVLFGTSIFSSVIIARSLGPEALGLWVVLNLIPSYSEVFFRVKTDYAAVYYLGQKIHAMPEINRALGVIALISSCSIVGIVLLFQDFILLQFFKSEAERVRNLLYVILVQIPCGFFYMNYIYLNVHKEDVRSLNRMVLTRALLSIFLIVSFITIFDLGFFGVVLGSTLGVLVATLVGWLAFEKIEAPEKLKMKGIYRDLIVYGLKVHVSSIVSHLNFYVGQFAVVVFLGPASVAFYTMAQQFSQYSEKITSALGTFLFPRMSGEPDLQASAELASMAFRVSSVIMLPIGLAGMLCIKLAVFLLYGNEFLEIASVFYIMLPGVILFSLSTMLHVFFNSINRSDLQYKIIIAPLMFQVGGCWFLIPAFGIQGAAICFSGSLALSALAAIVVFVHKYRLQSWGQMIPSREDVRRVLYFVRNFRSV